MTRVFSVSGTAILLHQYRYVSSFDVFSMVFLIYKTSESSGRYASMQITTSRILSYSYILKTSLPSSVLHISLNRGSQVKGL